VHQRGKLDHPLRILERELTEKQKKFIELALDKKVKMLLVSGPAGSTKTYLSVLAALLLMNEKSTATCYMFVASLKVLTQKWAHCPAKQMTN
jgi:predicted ribonuclease YlaK